MGDLWITNVGRERMYSATLGLRQTFDNLSEEVLELYYIYKLKNTLATQIHKY